MSIINNTLVSYDISYQEIDIIVTFLMTFFTFVIVIFNFKYLYFIHDTNPTYVRAKEIHSEKIKEMASEWSYEIPDRNDMFYFTEKNPNEYCAEVENEYFFNDLKEHDPRNLNMFKTWNEFKSKIDEINSLKFNLVNKINDKICSQTGLIYNNDFDSPGNIFTYEITNEILLRLDRIYYNGEFWPCSSDEFDGYDEEIAGEYYHIIRGRAKATHESQCISNLQKFLTIELEDIFDKEGWNDDFNAIGETISQCENIRTELNKKIDEFKSIPIYPEDCEIIKRVKKPFIWKIKNIFKKSN